MFVFQQEVTAKEAGTGIMRKILTHSSTLMLCQLHISKGTVIAEHTHFHEQSSYIISGSCHFTVGDVTKNMGAGDTVLIPGNVCHAVRALTDMVVIDVFSPSREDFLNEE